MEFWHFLDVYCIQCKSSPNINNLRFVYLNKLGVLANHIWKINILRLQINLSQFASVNIVRKYFRYLARPRDNFYTNTSMFACVVLMNMLSGEEEHYEKKIVTGPASLASDGRF